MHTMYDRTTVPTAVWTAVLTIVYQWTAVQTAVYQWVAV